VLEEALKGSESYQSSFNYVNQGSFDQLSIQEQIQFINDLARYIGILNPFRFGLAIASTLYFLRPYDGMKGKDLKDNEVYKPTPTYFIGHTPFAPFSINANNVSQIMECPIHPIHQRYLEQIGQSNPHVYSVSNYAAHLATYVRQNNSNFMNVLKQKYIRSTYGADHCTFDGFYFLDLAATYGLSSINPNPLTYNYLSEDRMNSFNEYYNKVRFMNRDELKQIQTIEIGYQMSAFAIVKNDYQIVPSDIYVF
jgi:hypothetical protein